MDIEARKPGRPRDPDLESRRKAEILAAAAKTFASRGFADTDVQEIADALKIGKGTVYRYFPTKQDLFLAAVNRGLVDLSAETDSLFEDATRDPLEMVRDAVTAYLKFFRKRPEMAELFIQERAVFRDRHTPLYFAEKYKKHDRDVPFINTLVRLGRFRKMKPDQVLDVVGDLLYGTILSNHLSGRDADPKKQAAAILDVLFHGLLSDSERKRIQRRAKGRIKATALAILFAFSVGCGGASSGSGAKTEPASITVTVEPVQSRTLPRTVNAVGTLSGFEEATLAPKVEGRIVAIRADIGDRVEPGAILLELDPKDYDLAISEATQALAAELAKLGLTKLPDGEIDASKVPSVRRAEATLGDANRRLKTKKALLATTAASADEVDVIETEVRIAEASRNHAVTEALAVLAAARFKQASLELAVQRRADCTLRAPVPSEWMKKSLPPGAMKYAVATRMVSEGEMVRSMPVTNAFRLVLDFKLKLKALVPERHVSEIAIGQTVEVKTDAYPNKIFKGTVARVNPTIDPANRTFLIEIEIPNEGGALKCGGFAKASIVTKTDSSVLSVPPAAIVSFAGVHKVFVLDGEKAKAVEVEVGTRDRNWVEVRGAFGPDVKVITSGLSQVVDGSAVRVR